MSKNLIAMMLLMMIASMGAHARNCTAWNSKDCSGESINVIQVPQALGGLTFTGESWKCDSVTKLCKTDAKTHQCNFCTQIGAGHCIAASNVCSLT